MTVSLDDAKKLARKWDERSIPATPHYVRKAKDCLLAFSTMLTDTEHSSLVGLIESYNRK